MGSVIVIEVVPVIIPDIQDTLLRDAFPLVGKYLVGTHHLDQRNLDGTECRRESVMVRYGLINMIGGIIVGHVLVDGGNTKSSCHIHDIIKSGKLKCFDGRNIQ